jgi:hypothetical protein
MSAWFRDYSIDFDRFFADSFCSESLRTASISGARRFDGLTFCQAQSFAFSRRQVILSRVTVDFATLSRALSWHVIG